jgi:broad specificity phosphatase PhoE
MGFAVDDLMEMPSPTETGEVEFHAWREWNDPYTTFRSRSLGSRAIAAFLDEQAKRALGVVDGLGDAGRVLVVGHGGWIEAVVAGLVEPDQLAHVGGSLWHLDGIRLSVSTAASVSIIDVHRHQN